MSYNDELLNGQSPKSTPPTLIKSAWPEMGHEQQIQEKVIFFIDLDGETIGQCADIRSAQDFIKKHKHIPGLVVRPYVWDEEELRLEIEKNRAKGRWNSGFGA